MLRVCSLMSLLLLGCGGGAPAEAPTTAARCAGGEHPAPTARIHGHLPGSGRGGAGSWVELESSTGDGVEVLLDGKPLTVVRVQGGGEEEHAVDATAGELTPRQRRTPAAAPGATAHLVGVRIPHGVAEGPHALVVRACGAASEEMPFDVLAAAAPSIDAIRLVRGEVWPALYIKGTGLTSVEEVLLVANDGTVTSLANITRVDDSQLRVSAEKNGTYEVFVRSANGVGGGPPNGNVMVR